MKPAETMARIYQKNNVNACTRALPQQQLRKKPRQPH